MNNKIINMYENGFAIRRIAVKTNTNEKLVKQIILDNNVKLKKETFTEDKIDTIISLYLEGVSAKNLGLKFSIDKRRVQKWANSIGKLRGVNESKRFTFFNETFFDKINSDEKAYWLGFFYADAYNCKITNTVGICLAYKDYDHVVKLSEAIDLPKEKIIKGYTELNNIRYDTATLKMYSKHLCDSLTKKGCPQAKSFIITFPDFLSKDLQKLFIRGLFDGDGSLCKTNCNNEWRFKLVSTKECLEAIKKIIYKATNIITNYTCISKTNNNTYEMVVCGNDQVLKIMHWLYGENIDRKVVLNRKYDKYLELISQQNARKINRDNYLISSNIKTKIMDEIRSGISYNEIAQANSVSSMTVHRMNKSIMNNSFINKYSWKCLLGSMSRNPKIIGNLATWCVGKNKIKKHFVAINKLNINDISFLKEYGCSRFHYMNEVNLLFLKEHFKVSRSKLNSTCIPMNDLSYIGRKYHGIRGAINKNKKLNLSIANEFKDVNDIKIMLNEWSEVLAQKYWQDHSGKNLHFYKNNFHHGCLNLFIYDKEKLIAFSCLSPEQESSYIIGKALTHKYPGLAEYIDDLAYQDAISKGIKYVNLGQSKGNIAKYKKKFPGAYNIKHFDGKIII